MILTHRFPRTRVNNQHRKILNTLEGKRRNAPGAVCVGGLCFLFSQDLRRQAVHSLFHELVKAEPSSFRRFLVSLFFPLLHKRVKTLIIRGVILVLCLGRRRPCFLFHGIASFFCIVSDYFNLRKYIIYTNSRKYICAVFRLAFCLTQVYNNNQKGGG